MNSNIIFVKTCTRCNMNISYLNENYINTIAHRSSCKICKIIPDDQLESFKAAHKYTRKCINCNNDLFYKTRGSFREAIVNNKMCKKCALQKSPVLTENKRKLREEWIPIIGSDSFTYKKLCSVRSHWKILSDEDRKKILNKTDSEKQFYWTDLRRRNRISGSQKWKQIISEKYAGKNHWMKRPEVISKIKESCKKYTGDNHWFRKNKIKPIP